MEGPEISDRGFISRLQRQLYTVFYQYLFGRETLISEQLTKFVHRLEVLQGRSDVPMAKDIWESQYKLGRWEYMAEIEELARYSTIISYMAFLKPGGSFLDVGCGEGILFERFQPYGYSRYIGIDISDVAVSKLIEKQDEKTTFIRAEAETYTAVNKFDIIIFNQSLCHIHDPLKVVDKFSRALKDDGVFLVSTFTDGVRAMSILEKLKTNYSLLDECRSSHEASSKSWICSILAPKHLVGLPDVITGAHPSYHHKA